ncbi:enoyl-CoA hydratase/isomerase family protein [Amycolatopsis acidicola]|uniref:Enoyl-CoA hydratase/isomerase family protein n=1 Tax=Amycolatopsis acidicola TaxID=2596893 RepID=A0A5N0UYM8_9PSEU|nr:enoyl-CoA hydratase/isomerase family protein [Amycolatopsis acidicola]KAA9157633.1 enoyl-CoA hydratase/isomerase family protein [Amycolatopsis acidicola]
MLVQDEYTRIRVAVDGGVATLVLNRPDRGNAADDAMHSELSAIFSRVRADERVRAVVLTGAGDTFCRGGDSAASRTFTTGTGLTPVQEARLIVESLLDLEKPVIAAVNGDAFGLGAVLATLADVAFVAPAARIGDKHVQGGVTAGNGSAALWPVLVGVNRAKYLVLGGAVLTAEKAVEVGLVHEVAEDPLTAASALAAEWAELPPFALRSTKSVLNTHLKEAAARALGFGLALEEQAMAGPEFAAVLAKRRAASG